VGEGWAVVGSADDAVITTWVAAVNDRPGPVVITVLSEKEY
jgi:hypothetical protein